MALLAARDQSSQNYYLRETADAWTSRRAMMRRAREYVLTHLADPMGVSDIARHVGLSAFHFHRLFTSSHGMTPGQYITREKIRRACRRLVLRDDSVAEIALACGFYSPTTFVATFRGVTGDTPSAFRKKRGGHRFELEFFRNIS